MRLLLAGATGTLGTPLVAELIAAGHDVVGIGRSPSGGDRIRSLGATALIADVLDRDALLRAVDGEHFDAVIHQLTALKKLPTRHSGMTATDTLRTTGSAHLVEVAQATGATRFVTQSIVFGYGYRDHGSRVLTEDDPFGVLQHDEYDPHIAAMAAAERLATTIPGVEGVALRYGLFYGRDLDRMTAMLRRRALPVTRGSGDIPFVHHDDAATATVAALERGAAGGAYNVVDDTPATFRQYVETVAALRAAPRPLVVPAWLIAIAAPYGKALYTDTSMRVSNARARTELGWEPKYPSIRDGIAAAETRR